MPFWPRSLIRYWTFSSWVIGTSDVFFCAWIRAGGAGEDNHLRYWRPERRSGGAGRPTERRHERRRPEAPPLVVALSKSASKDWLFAAIWRISPPWISINST